MSEIKPVAWCLMTEDRNIVNGIHEEERIAAQYKYRRYDDTLMPLYTSEQLAEAVAAERERCAKICEGKISGTFPDIQNPTDADHRQIAWDACCDDCAEAIRSAAK